jgi:(2Fe-2S) ferredoxin
MNKPDYHIFLCTSSRASGEPKGACAKKGSSELLQILEEAVADRGMDNVQISNTGCLKRCDDGPIMVIYPPGYWYKQVDEPAIEQILDALEQGQAAESLLLG